MAQKQYIFYALSTLTVESEGKSLEFQLVFLTFIP